ncbi:ribosomal protection-like ABC-F family protein [Oscillibacter sp.]|jgi:lincosamide and streptogramin A transport system ATP-binding/permease protein|uniref:ribosomal protection-like ABC-F family protein n=1 Tax=Oscillibacter sp. TaxID=1945593 RepID=UPI002173A82D|nr:ABC-F type ribosomal protection protein [Oscillibacter sp.]MCI9647990.1 ABC-F type ribosomal protection protein [Oscillibacter sp.]
MSMIRVENLTFAYPGSYDNIFENVSFQFDTGWKLGFLGRNGRGKTTFLRLLLGEYPCGGGISGAPPCAYFPREPGDPSRMTLEVLQEAAPTAEEWELLRETGLLGVEAEALYRPFSTLSNGERTKALLAALFCGEERYLLIDEPTNHLDARGRRAAAAYLRRKRGFLLVSHDRAFLDGCVDHVMALNRTGVEVQSGNFSSWWENKRRRDEFEQARNEHLQKEVGRLRQAAAQTSRWSDQVEATKKGTRTGGLRPDRGYIGHKSAKMMQRAKSIEDRRQRALEEKAGLLKDLERAEALKLRPLTARGRLLDARELSLFYGERRVCGPLDFRLEPGRRIALDGGNGCGKSTLLKFLLGEEIASQGTLVKLSGLTVSYVPQDTSHLRGRLRDYIRRTGAEEPLLLAILRKLDFPREQFEKNMEDWSAGQRKKVLIARSLCESAHLYIWDEPLNYIDVWSRMQIEELLLAFQPTMLFVEHDETFRQGVATETITIPCG